MILNTLPAISAPAPPASLKLYPTGRQHSVLPMLPSLGWAVWFLATTNSNLRPILWRSLFPADVQDALVSTRNPTGAITNSDLELAGAIGNQDVLVQEVDCHGCTTAGLCDKVLAVVWHRKGSTTTAGPAAYLLRLSSLHQRHFRYLATLDYIQGSANAMADDCSRLWHLTDSQLLAYVNAHYPQRNTWTLCHL
jgi:hypothetical protein